MPFINNHLVRVLKDKDSRITDSNTIATLFWGDEVAEIKKDGSYSQVVLLNGESGWVKGEIKQRKAPVLAVAFVDVGQGDAIFIETPDNKKILIDTGEEVLLARYLAKKFHKRNSKEHPLMLDAVVITHGDIDHYKGLIDLINSRDDFRAEKKLYCNIKRLYHNGLVKRSYKINGNIRKEIETFGSTYSEDNKVFVTDLIDNLVVDNSDFSDMFKQLAKALNGLDGITCKRLDNTDKQAFNFIDSNINIEILNPATYILPNEQKGLPFLHQPGTKSFSSSHTINGHSIVLRLTYGKAHFLFCADINREAEKKLLDSRTDLTTEVMKVPHHGSSDYDIEFLKKIKPVISIIPCGDGSEIKDYMHPRANLMAALGKYTRSDEPVIFSTETCSFFKYKGPALPSKGIRKDNAYEYFPKEGGKDFFAYEKIQYGIIHIRTDGEKLLAVRHSTREGVKESYFYEISQDIKVINNEIDML